MKNTKRLISLLLSVVLLLGVCVPAMAASESFTDIPDNFWAKSYIETAYANGWLNGVAENSFSPNGSMTRAMFVTVLYRVEGEPASEAAHPFDDVPDGVWYSDSVRWVYEKGVVNGTSNTEFSPNASITREQMAAILYRYAAMKGYDTSASADLSRYQDAGKISDYAVSAMKWAVGSGIMNGRSDTSLAPSVTATRAEVTTLVCKYVDDVENGEVAEPRQYMLSFAANGGTEVKAITVTNGTGVELSRYTTTRSGYTFLGWYSDSTLMTKVTSVTVTGDMTVYAAWERELEYLYTLSFVANGGTAVKTINVLDGTDVELSQYTTTRSGYTFLGWYSDSTLMTKVTSVTVTGNMTVYAAGDCNFENPCTLYFQSNGGTPVEPITVERIEMIDLENIIPERPGYYFAGWCKAGNGVEYKTCIDEDTIMYAAWMPESEPQSYYLSFIDNGGFGFNSIEAVEGTVIDVTKYIPVYEGYDFTGWYSDEALTQKVTSVTLTEETKIYAGWEKADGESEYGVLKFLNNDEILTTRKVKNGTTVDLSDYKDVIPEKPGYTFLGWSSNSESPEFVDSITVKDYAYVCAFWLLGDNQKLDPNATYYTVDMDTTGGEVIPKMLVKAGTELDLNDFSFEIYPHQTCVICFLGYWCDEDLLEQHNYHEKYAVVPNIITVNKDYHLYPGVHLADHSDLGRTGEHRFHGWIEFMMPASCTEGPYLWHYCSCGYETKTYLGDPNGHTPSEEIRVEVEPTYESDGIGYIVCETCGEDLEEVVIERLH